VTLVELPRDHPVQACPEVHRDLGRAYSVAADLDRVLSVWCGICRFEQGHEIALPDLLGAWPMLKWQEVPKMGQTYERSEEGLWHLREIMER
jgi:hypothetical protein